MTSFLEWTVALIQTALLFGPAYYLSGLGVPGDVQRRAGERVIRTSLWATGLVYLHYLQCLAIGVYTWPVALGLHGATVAAFVGGGFFAPVLLRPRMPGENARPRVSAPPFKTAFESAPVRFAWLAVAAVTLTGVILNLRTPPGGWDALTYHLDFPVQWALAGRIFPAITAYGDYSPTYYPALVEAFAGWYLLPARGPAFADLVQVLFVPLLYCAIRDIAYYYRGGRVDRPVSVAAEFAPLVILSLPYLQSSLLVADNDFVLCALLLAAWRGALYRGGLSFAAAIPAALVLTVKYTGPVYAGALGLALLLATGVARLRGANRSKQIHARAAIPNRGAAFGTVAGLACVAALGASPYLLNWWATGNPLYPATVDVFGLRIFDGYYPREFFKRHPFHEFRWGAFFTEPGLSLPLLAAVAASITVALSRIRLPRLKWNARGAGSDAMPAAPFEIIFEVTVVPAALLLAFYVLVPLRQFRLALVVIACCGPALILFEFAEARFKQAIAPGVFARALTAGLLAVVVVQCSITILRFAEIYGDPRPFAILISLNEISRATVTRFLFQDPTAAIGFALLAIVVGAFLAGARAAYGHRGARLAVYFVAVLLPAWLAAEQRHSTYAGDGLAAAYRAVQAMRGEATGDLRDKNTPPMTGADRIQGGIGVVGTNALLPFRGRRPLASPNAGRVHLLLNRPGGRFPLHLREESLRFDPASRSWLAIGTLAYREYFDENLNRYDIRTLIVATTIGTGGRWPAEYEWLQTRPAEWQCAREFSNAASGDPGARVAICSRRTSPPWTLKNRL